MKLYNVTLWDADAGKNGESVHLSIVAATDKAMLREVNRYKGEITRVQLVQSGLIIA